MRIAVAVVVCLVFDCVTAQAAFTDFSDYTQNQTFATDEIFQSQGVAFKALDWQATGPFPILNPVAMVASPSFAALYPGPGVEFLLPLGTQEVSLYYSTGAGSGIAINGVEPAIYPGQGGTPYEAGFEFLNGASLAGVDVSTALTTNQIGLEEGVLTLRGPINTLRIAGLELLIDDVTVLVPEPNSVVLILASATIMMAARPRRRI